MPRQSRRRALAVLGALGMLAALPLAPDAAAKLPPKASDRCPAWSPDGKLIAFSSNGERSADLDLHLMNADGTGRHRLTKGPGVDFCPAWSPDGRRIAFPSYRRGGLDLYVVDADGRNVRLLVADVAQYDPSWSPDGSRLAFSREHGESAAIHVVDADGRNERRLTRNPGRIDVDPTWSPDGRRIAFTSQNVRNTGDADIYVIGADGRHQRRLTIRRTYVDGPAWSPDGKWIAVARDDRKGDMDVWLIGADGRTQWRLDYVPPADPDRYAWPPLHVPTDAFAAWSPDGKRIAFASDRLRSGSFRLYVMGADGRNELQLTK